MKTEPIWIVLIVTILAYIGAYFALIAPNHKETDKFLKQIDAHVKTAEQSQKEEIPGRPMIDAYIAGKKDLVQGYEGIVKFYEEKDKKFELWFEGLSDNPNEEPPVARFASILTDKIKQVKEALTLTAEQKKPLIAGSGKPDEFERVLAFVLKSPDGLKVVQKSWWMFEQIFEISKKNNVHRFLDCSWPKPNLVDEIILGKKPVPLADGAPPVDEVLFGYTTFPLKLKLEIPYASVSLFLEDLLSTSANTRVMFGLQEIKIIRAEMKKEHLGKVDVYWDKLNIASEEEQALQRALKKIQKEQETTQKDVTLEIDLFAYDFFTRKQPIPVEKPK